MSMLRRSVCRAVFQGCAIFLVVLTAALASAEQPSAPSADNYFYFYRDPRAERLIDVFAHAQSTATSWDAFPPLVGLLAAVFKLHPELIDRLAPIVKDVKASYTLIAASRLSGQPAKAEALRAKFANLGLDERLNSELAGLPIRFEDLKITRPTHLDILWGASFAGGDGRYVIPIIDYVADTANSSELVAIDIAKIAVEMSGGPKGAIEGLKGKYGDARAMQLIYAATALWAIGSNSRQHDYVKRTVTKYIGDHRGTPATKALSALTGVR